MKIIFAAYHNKNFISITEYCEKAMRELGYECIPFDDRSFILPGRVRQISENLYKWDLEQLNRRLLKYVSKEKPDVCIVAGGHRIKAKTVQSLKAKGVTTVLWTIDPPRFFDLKNSFSILHNVAPTYDYVFCGGTEAIELLEDLALKNISWLPFACDTDFHKPVEIDSQACKHYARDIVFVGSFYESRLKLFEQISDLNIGIWGPGWEKVPENSPLKPRIMSSKNLAPDIWLKIYACAKIVIISHYQDGQTLCYQVSPKVYEALACKCMTLVDDQRDIKPNFMNREHLAVFSNAKELRENINYYLANPDKANIIAAAGYQEAIHKHTYKHRIKQLLNTIRED